MLQTQTPPPSSAYSMPGNHFNRSEQRIKEIICEEVNKVELMAYHYGKGIPLICTPENILTKKRDIEYKTARFLIALFLIYLRGFSTVDAGKAIGRDHATVINARKKINDYVDTDQAIRKLITSIFDRFSMSDSERIEFLILLSEKDLRLKSK